MHKNWYKCDQSQQGFIFMMPGVLWYVSTHHCAEYIWWFKKKDFIHTQSSGSTMHSLSDTQNCHSQKCKAIQRILTVLACYGMKKRARPDINTHTHTELIHIHMTELSKTWNRSWKCVNKQMSSLTVIPTNTVTVHWKAVSNADVFECLCVVLAICH